ncbi:MAG: hypothetical protein LBP63_07855 [Prevotellaceae bacterium]|jgi:hypothetical protein|nr:hypothetical protein [Prevotellaceae bacterium]
MEIVFNKLYKIDIAVDDAIEKPEYQNLDNFKIYIQGMLEQISAKSPDRYYEFKSEYTEIHNLIRIILSENEYKDTGKAIANRLLNKEKEAQNDLNKKKLGTEILKGMLIVSLVKMTDEARKMIILKVDYEEFISEITGNIVSGLSIRRKVYKAFIYEINNHNEQIAISVFDTNTPVSVYWWDKFLELEVVTTNAENTKNAFSAIETEILNPIKKKHKQDYLLLWNATVAYFRREGEFNLSHYRDDIIGDYTPFDDNLDINGLKSRVDKLPIKYKFDPRFDKVPSKIQKRFKNILHLTDEITLVLKHDVADPKTTFKSHEDADGKYLMIRSDKGYEYAKEIRQKKLNN